MKALFFDAGPIISLVMSRLSWLLPELKEQFNGTFYITPAVRYELVERPLTVRRFQFEALQVMKLITDGVLEVYTDVPEKKVDELITLANHTFTIGKKNMDIVQRGEVESVAAALPLQAGVVMDERTLRLFIENPTAMKELLEHRFKRKVTAIPKKLLRFSKQLQGVPIIRSIELVSVAFKLGLLNGYIPKKRGGKAVLLESVLWATKYNGCAVTNHEVEEIKAVLLER
jgi:hypothetical protein